MVDTQYTGLSSATGLMGSCHGMLATKTINKNVLSNKYGYVNADAYESPSLKTHISVDHEHSHIACANDAVSYHGV
jgi:hypothetical protein